MKPYNSVDAKSEQVERMFDNIAPTYDLLNHLLSLRIDVLWRKKLVKIISRREPKTILDVASGTGDLSFALASKCLDAKVQGLDLSAGMTKIAMAKAEERKLGSRVQFIVEDVEKMSFEDDSFDAVTCGFGVRNFEHLKLGLSSMARVLKKGGCMAVLEFSTPENKIFATFYRFYFHKLLPWIGALLSKDQKAYKYLPQSVEEFAGADEFVALMQDVGFKDVKAVRLMMGIAYIYYGEKK